MQVVFKLSIKKLVSVHSQVKNYIISIKIPPQKSLYEIKISTPWHMNFKMTQGRAWISNNNIISWENIDYYIHGRSEVT